MIGLRMAQHCARALHCLAEHILWCGRESLLDQNLFCDDLSIPAKLVGLQAVHACIHMAAACAENEEQSSPSPCLHGLCDSYSLPECV